VTATDRPPSDEPSILVAIPRDSNALDILDADLRDRIDALGPTEWYHPAEPSAAELRDRLAGVEACITGWGTPTLDAEVLSAASNLQFVGHVGGSVSLVASDELYDRGCAVVSANDTLARSVAEGTLASVLAHLRDVPAFHHEIQSGDWADHEIDRLDTLYGADVGLVGLGTIGRHLCQLLDPFEVTIRVYDPYVDAADLPAGAAAGSLDSVLEESSVVSIHASLTDETVGLLDGERLDRLPDGALLVNTARGPIVDEDALLDRLRDGELEAALDVYWEEPLPEAHPLRSLDNVLLQPHTAGWAHGSGIAETVVEELERFVADEPLRHEIPHSQYELMT
jgi:phosphoglycerate dehydrogenase-like enzyme